MPTTNANLPETKPDKSEFVCHPRRHMTASEFRTYDTMLAMIGSKPHDKDDALIFHGRLTKLANYNNTSVETENLNLKSLVNKGWVKRVGKQRWRAGRWGTVQYLIVDHEKYVYENPALRSEGWTACPPYRYDMETSDNVSPGKLKPGLVEAVRKKQRGKLIRALFTDGLYPMGKPEKKK